MKKWIGIEISCNEELADDLAAEIGEAFGVGVEIIEQGIRFYLEGDRFLKAWEERLRELLDTFRNTFDPTLPLTYRHFLLNDENWADRWKEHFKPLRIGRSFLICPTWEKVRPDPADRVILMDPGRAFGTGHHETTRLCLEWLEDWAEHEGNPKQCSLLDVGTGSGILSIAAALLGCKSVLGIDNDPEAIEVARENLLLNRLTSRIRLLEGTVSDVSDHFEVVLANIQALPLIKMAPDLVGRLADEGRLVLSGILTEQKDKVRAAYEQHKLNLTESRVCGEWCLLVLCNEGR